MKRMILRRLAAAAALLLAPVCIKAQAATYTLKRIEIPGAVKIAATGMNDAGYIVGTYIGDRGRPRSFLMRGGIVKPLYSMVELGGRAAAYPISIDNKNGILGESCLVVCLGATYTGTHQTYSFGLGPAVSEIGMDRLVARNDLDTVVYLAEGIADGFSVGTEIGNAQGFAPIPAPTGTEVYASSINNAGTVAGTLIPVIGTTGTAVAFTYANNTFNTVAIPDATAIGDVLINNKGELAGVYTDVSNHPHLWFYNAGKLHVFTAHAAHAYLTLSEINATGEVAGTTDVPGTTTLTQAFVYRGGPDLEKIGEWNNVLVSVGALTSDGRVLITVNGTKSYVASCTDC